MAGVEPWQRLTDLATRQHGVTAARDLERLGVERRRRENWERRGLIERVAPGVWRIAGTPDTWHQRLQVGLLYLGDDAVISHEAAAQLHGFARTPPDRIDLLVPRGARRWRLPFGTVHTTKYLPRIDRARVDGWPVTSATRTVLDLAMLRPEPVRVEAAIDSAIRSRASAPVVLQRRLAGLRGPGRWGSRLVDELTLDAGGETLLERRFLALMRTNGLPRPTTQRWFAVEGRPVGRADFTYEPLRIVVEVSGGRGHSTPAERAKDAQRRNELQDLGWRVFEYTWDDVTRRPTYVVRTMRARFAQAGWTAGWTAGERSG
ncbi:MAG: type IV toxin-antitoxin system AbiEi family antitoxin domain-containing protein [Ilumatobacteraceae bacterium]